MYLSPQFSGNFVLIDGRPGITRGFEDQTICGPTQAAGRRRTWAVQFLSANGLSRPRPHPTTQGVWELPPDPSRRHLRPGPGWVLLLVGHSRLQCEVRLPAELLAARIPCRLSYDPHFPLVYVWVPADQWEAARQAVSGDLAKYLF